MSTSTQPAALAALPEQAGTSAALHERPTTNDHQTNGGQSNGHQANSHPSNGHTPKTSNGHDRWRIVLLSVEKIDPNPWQPRTLFDPQEMEELTQSVKAHGVQQPVIVRIAKPKPEENGSGTSTRSRSKKTPQRFELIAGERRLRASVAAGKRSIPVIVRDDLSDLQVAEMALLENVQRANLSVIEEARGYRRLMLDFRLSEERLAKKVGKSVPVLREMMKLLALPEGVQQLIRLRKLTAAHGHELLRLTASPEACNSVAAYAVNANIPATALAKDPLPTARELEKRGLIVPLDYRTRFDRSRCKTCPHKAYVGIGFNAYSGYCLRPDEWKRKQDEVLEREKDESARVLEEARRQSESQTDSQSQTTHEEGGTEDMENGPQLPVLSQLPRNSYRDLRFGDLPPGCTSACSCRGCALDPHASAEPQAVGEEEESDNEKGVRVAICLNPARYAELQREERVRRDEERKRHFTDRFEKALHLLHSNWEEGRCDQAVALAFTPFLEGRCSRGAYLSPSQWQAVLVRVAEHLDMKLPFERLFEPDTNDEGILRALSGQDVEQETEEEEAFEPLQLVLLGAGVLLALEAEGASRYGGETPMLDFVLPPASGMQRALALEEEMGDQDDEEWGDEEEDEDPFMEEDFAVPQAEGDPDTTNENDSAAIVCSVDKAEVMA